MTDKESKKREIVALLSLDKRKIDQMDEQELIQIVERVDSVRSDAVKDGRFLDADNAKSKLKLLREALDRLRKRDIKNKHSIEKNKLEEDFASEIQSFSNHWGDKISAYQQECKRMEQELLAHNQATLEEYRNQLQTNLPERPKDSARLLDMKVQLDQLVRKEDYKDAHYQQQRIADLERAELDKHTLDRNKKIENLIEQKLVQQQNEYNSLRKRVLNGLDELELQRKAEYDRLFLKYNNVKKNIENQQNAQSYLLEKSMKTASLQQSIRNYFTIPQDGSGERRSSDKNDSQLVDVD